MVFIKCPLCGSNIEATSIINNLKADKLNPRVVEAYIEKELRPQSKIIIKELGRELRLIESIICFIGKVLKSTSEKSIQDNPLEVSLNLIVRLSNDLQMIKLLVYRGYHTQALTLAASVYEIAFTVAYIGSDDVKAEKWMKHDDPKNVRIFGNFRDITEEGLRNLRSDEPEKTAEFQYKRYRMFCMAKHGNPLYQSLRGIDEEYIVKNGPDTSEQGIRDGWVAMYNAICLVLFIALYSFILNHVQNELKDNFINKIYEYNKEINPILELAKKRWGVDDPFPDKW